jgi:hypothetical protein
MFNKRRNENGIEHRLTKIRHPEKMTAAILNRTCGSFFIEEKDVVIGLHQMN